MQSDDNEGNEINEHGKRIVLGVFQHFRTQELRRRKNVVRWEAYKDEMEIIAFLEHRS